MVLILLIKTLLYSQGIKVLRVKDIFSEPVSDTVLYILLFQEKIIEKHNLVKNNNWGKVVLHDVSWCYWSWTHWQARC